MNYLETISQTNERISENYRNSKSLSEIESDLTELDFNKVTNEHLFNLKSMFEKDITVEVTSIEKLREKEHTMDLEIDDESHSYYCNGIPTHNTVNLPADYPYEEFKQLYTLFHETGTIKGGTTYRDGTMTAVLSSTEKKNEKSTSGIVKSHAPKRPDDLDCEIHHSTVKGEKWIVIVGLLENDPYEVFAFKQKQIQLPRSFKEGTLRKVKRGHYDLLERGADADGMRISDIRSLFDTDEEEALTRIISTALRHGADVKFVVEQLNKSEGTVVSFAKAIARTLKKYLDADAEVAIKCEECGSDNVAFEDGCFTCKNCGSSKCS